VPLRHEEGSRTPEGKKTRKKSIENKKENNIQTSIKRLPRCHFIQLAMTEI
jgi:hypothetical protein